MTIMKGELVLPMTLTWVIGTTHLSFGTLVLLSPLNPEDQIK